MLELNNISYHPSTAEKIILDSVNLTARIGKPTIIKGSSGSGKTSLIEVISGLSGPRKGSIKWEGNDLNNRQRKWLSGVVFQFPERHFLGLNIIQELRIGHIKFSQEKQSKILKKVGLEKLNPRQSPENLSGGQQRRLAIAIQLIKRPKILLLDEPTAGLDWSVKEEIINLLKDLANEQVMIVVTHEPHLFDDFEASCYELEKGKLVKLN